MNNTNIYTMEDTRVENWRGNNVRFVEYNGEWYAVLKDICDIFGLRVAAVSSRLDPDYLEKVRINGTRFRTKGDVILNDLSSSNGVRHTQTMTIIHEFGIYELMYASKKLEARHFRKWAGETFRILRKKVGLEGYQVLRLMEPEIQDEITWYLENVSWDEATKQLVYARTVPGGDVEVIPLDEWAKEN